ncbi:MAG: ABC transporter substrate-binding protein [Lautropia sp.]
MSAGKQLWYSRCPLPTASGIAVDNGSLARRLGDAGWSLEPIENAPQTGARDSHFTHATPGLFRQGGNIPPIWARSEGADTALVGIAWTREFQAILARPDAGIRSPADLAGRRLGLPVRTSGEIDFWRAMCLRGFDSALRLAGLTLADAELCELPVHERYIPAAASGEGGNWMWAGSARARRQQAETFAFIRGEVDAIYASGALGLQLQALLGAAVVVDLGFHPDPDVSINNQVPNILTVDGQLARRQPEVVAAYIRALREAATWSRSVPDLANRTCAREVGAPEEWITPSYHDEAVKGLQVSLEDRLVAAVASQQRFLLEHGFVSKDFSIDDWVDPTPMNLAIEEEGLTR